MDLDLVSRRTDNDAVIPAKAGIPVSGRKAALQPKDLGPGLRRGDQDAASVYTRPAVRYNRRLGGFRENG